MAVITKERFMQITGKAVLNYDITNNGFTSIEVLTNQSAYACVKKLKLNGFNCRVVSSTRIILIYK